jgi:hypothetical protein
MIRQYWDRKNCGTPIPKLPTYLLRLLRDLDFGKMVLVPLGVGVVEIVAGQRGVVVGEVEVAHRELQRAQVFVAIAVVQIGVHFLQRFGVVQNASGLGLRYRGLPPQLHPFLIGEFAARVPGPNYPQIFLVRPLGLVKMLHRLSVLRGPITELGVIGIASRKKEHPEEQGEEQPTTHIYISVKTVL